MTESRITQLYPPRSVSPSVGVAGSGSPSAGVAGSASSSVGSGQSASPDARGDAAALTDDELLALYASPTRWQPRVSANFISSLDGSASAGGLSGGLGSSADRRVFDLQRRVCDVVLVGAGTVRAEGYGAMRVGPIDAAWRLSNGFAEHPTFAIVSGRLDLDPQSDVFTKAPVRPIVLTAASADPVKRVHLEAVAEVVTCGEKSVEAAQLVAALTERGLVQVHCEGGPSLLGSFVAADLLDQLCLSVSPSLEGGQGPRIVTGGGEIELRPMRLDHVLLAGSMLLTKYSRVR